MRYRFLTLSFIVSGAAGAVAMRGMNASMLSLYAASLIAFWLARWKVYSVLLKAAGRARHVPFGLCLRAQREQWRLDRATKRIGAASKLLETDAAGFELWQTPRGRFWMPARPLAAESLFEMQAECDLGVYGHGRVCVKPGDVVLDGGANVGVFVAVALRAGAAKVIASEPSPENLECLRRNFKEEIEQGRVTLYPKGLWNCAERLQLHVGKSPAGDSFVLTQGKSSGPYIEAGTIDEMMRELALERLDFIKMDIEGAERHALKGGRRTLEACHPRMAISAYHLEDDPEVLREVVETSWSGYAHSGAVARLNFLGLLSSNLVPKVYFFG